MTPAGCGGISRRLLCGVTIAVIVGAACTGGGSNSEPGITAPLVAAPDSSEIGSGSSSVPPTESSPTNTDLAEGEPTAIETAEERATSTCSLLTEAGFETRRELIADEESALAAETQCPTEFQRTVDATAVRTATAKIATAEQPVEVRSVRCADGAYSFIATNPLDVPIGVHASLRVFVGDEDVPTFSGDYPVVIWSLEPGESLGIEGTFNQPDAEFRCTVGARVFNADQSPADASLPARTDPAVVGDDPSEWFGSLLDLEIRSAGSADPDAAARYEDIRSVGYAAVLDAVSGDERVDRAPVSITICNGSIDQPSPERVSFLYFITYPTEDGGTESSLRHGLFRRGGDEQWRWLSSPQFFNSPDFWGCGTPS